MSEPTLITIKEFANRIMIGETKAREMSRSKALCDAKISVKINPDSKTGGTRIDWPKYLEYIGECPAIREHRKVRSKNKKSS